MMHDPGSQSVQAQPAMIDAVFRNGSLTGISVMLGFSLSFLTRWAGTPGFWHALDLVALGAITFGILLQTIAFSRLLSLRSLSLKFYKVSVNTFLIGLVIVGLGVSFAIAGDIIGYGQRVLN